MPYVQEYACTIEYQTQPSGTMLAHDDIYIKMETSITHLHVTDYEVLPDPCPTNTLE